MIKRVHLFVQICFVVVVALMSPAHGSTVSPYVAAYDKDLEKLRGTPGFASHDNQKGALAWSESYVLMSLMDMYHATNRLDYLQQVAKDGELVLQQRDDKTRRQDYRGVSAAVWSDTSYSNACDTSRFKNCSYGWIVQDGMITEPLADFSQIIIKNKSLWNIKAESGRSFIDIAHTFVAAVAETISAHDDQWDARIGGYRERSDAPISVAGQVLPYNRYAAMGSTLVKMYLATGKVDYLNKINSLAEDFKSAVKYSAAKDAYVWNYASYYPHAEDISHGTSDINFAYLCYQQRIVFTQLDMHRFANAFANVAYLGNDHFSPMIDGSRMSDTPYFNMQIGRWLILASFNPAIYRIVENHFKSYFGGSQIVTTSPAVLQALAGLALYSHDENTDNGGS